MVRPLPPDERLEQRLRALEAHARRMTDDLLELNQVIGALHERVNELNDAVESWSGQIADHPRVGRGRKVHLDADIERRMVAAYQRGSTVAGLARAYNLDRSVIRRVLRDRGVEIRSGNGEGGPRAAAKSAAIILEVDAE